MLHNAQYDLNHLLLQVNKALHTCLLNMGRGDGPAAQHAASFNDLIKTKETLERLIQETKINKEETPQPEAKASKTK